MYDFFSKNIYLTMDSHFETESMLTENHENFIFVRCLKIFILEISSMIPCLKQGKSLNRSVNMFDRDVTQTI